MEEGASAAAGGRRRGRDCDDEQITRRDTHGERNERRERETDTGCPLVGSRSARREATANNCDNQQLDHRSNDS